MYAAFGIIAVMSISCASDKSKGKRKCKSCAFQPKVQVERIS